MSELILWKNREMTRLREDMDRLFKSCGSHAGLSIFLEKSSENITIQTMATKDSFIVEAVLRDLGPEDLEIFITNEKLTLKGSRKKQAATVNKNNWFEKRYINCFIRTIPLPFRIEFSEVKAVLKGNLLKINLPRWKPEKIYIITIESRTP